MVSRKGQLVIHPDDIREQLPQKELMDYVLEPYAPQTEKEGLWHSQTLFRHFLRHHGLLKQIWPIVSRLQEYLGLNKTVWGLKYDHNRNPGVEFYFYNHCRNDASNLMSVSRLSKLLAGLIHIDGVIDESLPYIMCSLELDLSRLKERTSEGFRIYLAGKNPDGVSYLHHKNTLIRENRYWFYKAHSERDKVVKKMQNSLHGEARANLLLHPQWCNCYTICFAEKRYTDALYFSRISTDNLQLFAKNYLQSSIGELLQEESHRFAHLCWDVGYDFQRKANKRKATILKAGLYGFL